jgi:hypothetical protein
VPPRRLLEKPLTLAEAIAAMEEIKDAELANHAASTKVVDSSSTLTVLPTTVQVQSQSQPRERTRLSTRDFDEQSTVKETAIENDHQSPRLAVVTSSKDPNQIELPLNAGSEEETFAA